MGRSRWECPDCGSSQQAKPRYATKPTPRAKTWQQDIFRAAEAMRMPLMPWQRLSARLLAELSPVLCRAGQEGSPCIDHEPMPIPRFSLVVASVPRQSGKTTVARASLGARSQRGDEQEMFGTALTRDAAAKQVIKTGMALQRFKTINADRQDLLRFLPLKVLTGKGQERVQWPNGSTYDPIAPNDAGGHGESIAFFLGDEAWKSLSAEVMVGVFPAMLARPHAQKLLISTMGTVDSHTWNSIVADGRASVDDPNASIAYVEYSAQADEDAWKEEMWHSFMPALGRTISHKAVWDLIRDLESDPDEGPTAVVRSIGNRTVKSLVRMFPADWVEDAWATIEPPQRFVIAVDVNDEPAGSAITTGHIIEDGRPALRMVDHRPTAPGWVPGAVAEMLEKRKVDAVVIDPSTPTRQIRAELVAVCERRAVPLIERTARDVAADVLGFYNALRERQVVMVKSEPLESAIGGAVKRQSGDFWYINRNKMTVDASPLISSILAHGTAAELAIQPAFSPLIY